VTSVCGDQNAGDVLRDARSMSLANLLNNKKEIFSHFSGSAQDYEKFVAVLYPWIIADTPVPVKTVSRTDYLNNLQCNNPLYSNSLTGAKVTEPKILVDFVPFGYDVDLLHVRLHEAFNAVDAFVIFESTRTQSALNKPLYFSAVKDSSRFKPYSDKIIYVNATDKDLEQIINQVRNAKTPKFDGGKWALEFAMRTEMIRLFKAIPHGQNKLKDKIMGNIGNVWGIQNDADELPSGKALFHFKHCSMKGGIKAVYLPCLSFKKNLHWLQTTSDMICFNGVNESAADIKRYMWRGAPYLWPLSDMLNDGSTLRYNKYKLDPCTKHLGIGASIHLSSIADPVSYWLKKGYVTIL
jgi:hypothetical protein